MHGDDGLQNHIELAKNELFYSKARRHGRTVFTLQIMYQGGRFMQIIALTGKTY